MDYKNLEEIGLKQEESHIYGYILQKAVAKAGEIAAATGLKRGLTYSILETLTEKGLILKHEKPGKITEFSATHPENLQKLIEREEYSLTKKKEVLSQTLPSLLSLYNLNNDKPHVQFYEGEAGVWKILNDTLTAKEMIYQYVDLESIELHAKDINTKYIQKRDKADIEKQILVSDSNQARTYFNEYLPQITTVKIMPELTKMFATTMMIYDGKVSYINFKNNSFISVLIEDPEFYATQKAIFEYTWKLTPRISELKPRQNQS